MTQELTSRGRENLRQIFPPRLNKIWKESKLSAGSDRIIPGEILDRDILKLIRIKRGELNEIREEEKELNKVQHQAAIAGIRLDHQPRQRHPGHLFYLIFVENQAM